MVRELVFHLGDCKTGSTSIQTVLARGGWHSTERSLFYPAMFNHIPLAKTLTQKAGGDDRQWAQVARRLSRDKADVGVISAEHFEFVDPGKLARQLERHFGAWEGRIRLISYVRPHAERFLSTFAERSKLGGRGKSMEQVLNQVERDGRFHYLPRVTRWRETFGGAFTVRPFLRDRLKDGDVVRDFFDYVFEGREVGFTDVTDQNESLSVEDLTILREIHRKLKVKKDPEMRNAQEVLGRNLARFLTASAAPNPTRLRLHRALAERIAGIYAEDARAMDATFFEGTPMTDRLGHAVRTAVAEPVSLDPADYHAASTLRLVDAWAGFTGHVMKADPGHFTWACRPTEFRRDKSPEARVQPKPAGQTPERTPPSPMSPMSPTMQDRLKDLAAMVLPAVLDRRLRRAWRAFRSG